MNEPDQLGLGLSSVNWMSPQYELAVDWNALLSGYAPNNGTQQGIENDRGGLLEEGGDQQTGPDHQMQQQMQTEVDLGPSRSTVGSAISSNSTEGRYYVDGSGARAPFGGRSHNRDSIGGIEPPHENVSSDTFSLPSLGYPEPDLLCSAVAYDNLIQTLVAETQLQALHIDNASLPSRAQIQLYVRQYFKNFHPIFPFLRKSSFADDAQMESLLLLAVSVVGARYTRRLQGIEPGEMLFRLLNTILRRRRYGYGFYCDDGVDNSSFVPGQRMEKPHSPSLQMLQAGILNVACMMHSDKKALVESAFVERHYLVEACHSMELISQDPERSSTQQHGQEFMKNWILRESQIRTGMMIWFLDSMFVYEFDAKPLMQIDDIKATLPSHEDLWENPDLMQQGKKFFADVTLLGALETIYMEKRLPPHLGEFSMGLLINAIYRNTIQIMAREQIRLNSWTPTAIAQHRSPQVAMQQNLSPITSTMSKWRNSACDCLDVLHWPANSKAAQLSGSEHHTILHLHLARLIILTPTTDIQTFATCSISAHSNNLQSSRKYVTARHHVLQWILRDRFKARLSIVHCGALYWHVRRYSCDSMLEPYAIYMATLVLWAFCVSMRLSEVVEAAAHDNEEEPEPSFLHLDRPLDDELVQTFVRLGHKMSAYISKVGNIQSRDAPAKILQEGISLLVRDSYIAPPRENRPFASSESPRYTWGIEGSFAKSLRDLLQATATELSLP
ncbi:hypothetical protein DM02DRAFT_519122 [Periconia macrospinosa]|uniref:Xylanolytic transcriptional activator regulatory domain-containing protein n=1 Tax=Periconia macrospinosa TaxID=97972 RepID=A0A2V1E113_9PLEO|nr:hypothetical protein DM02DRAFT_519122 [Periconia macrospinosa]